MTIDSERTSAEPAVVNVDEVRGRVRDMYRQVADAPGDEFHFELGRTVANRLGYPTDAIDAIPPESVESFAGVGFPFAMTEVNPEDRVLDLGSGSGMDVFYAAQQIGPKGRVVGVDMTAEQLAKARRLVERAGLDNVEFVQGYIEEIPVPDASVDLVVSNGVINLSAQKQDVFDEIARVLAPGGRMAISDIVTEKQLSESIVCDASLWAACIGGAAQEDDYRSMIERAGLQVEEVREHPEYQFLSKSARNASKEYGVKSVSVLASKAA